LFPVLFYANYKSVQSTSEGKKERFKHKKALVIKKIFLKSHTTFSPMKLHAIQE